MRNLKKVLALVLALVMAMSLVTMANAADFSDSADINYKEAVDVMTAIGVIDGLDTGAFNPTGTLTREQAAKIIATMMLGEGADKLGTTSSSFTDVAATRWSSPYIEYCASIGVIAGNGDGTYNPTGKLTGHAFAKMLLGALGYDSDREGYVGAGWSIEVAKDAVTAGITVDGVSMSAELTREQAAQMAFQTLQATTVEYATAGSVITTPDGTTVVTGGSTASKVETDAKKAGYDGEKDGYVQFCETYFPKLTKSALGNDDFGRPGYTWKYKSSNVAFTSADAAVVFTEKMTESEVKSAIKSFYDEDAKISVWTDGDSATAAKKTYKQIANLTGNGVTVSLFTDSETDDLATIVVMNTYFGKVTKVTEKDDETTATVNVLAGPSTSIDTKSVETSAFEKDDYVIFNVAKDGDKSYVTNLSLAEIAEGEITAATSVGGKENYLRMDGTRYDYNANMKVKDDGEVVLGDATIYLDALGYVIYVGETEAAVDNYLYVKATDEYMNEVSAKVVLPDGTIEVVTLSEDGVTNPTDGSVYKYTTDGDEYVLEGDAVASTKTDATIKRGNPTLATGLYADTNTVFVMVKDGKTYTGYKEVPSLSKVDFTYVTDKDNTKLATLVFITDSEAGETDDSTLFYVATPKTYEKIKIDGVAYRVYTNVYVDGEAQDMTIKDSAAGVIDVQGLYKTTNVDDEGNVTGVSKVKAKTAMTEDATYASSGVLVVGETTYTYDDDTLFVVVDGQDVTTGSIDSVICNSDVEAGDEYTSVYVAKYDEDSDNLAELVYLVIKTK